jgi:hypothetical protein
MDNHAHKRGWEKFCNDLMRLRDDETASTPAGTDLTEIDAFTSELANLVAKPKGETMPIFQGAAVPKYGSGEWALPHISLRPFVTIEEFQSMDKTGVVDLYRRVHGRCPIEEYRGRMAERDDWVQFLWGKSRGDTHVGLPTAPLTADDIGEYILQEQRGDANKPR